VSSRIYSVWTIRAGKIARFREFYDERAALGAVGLRECARPGPGHARSPVGSQV
jgi:hypothetical protein